MSRNRREANKSCCTWPRIFSFVVTLAVASFLLWWFEPWSYILNNDSIGDSESNGDGSTPQTAKPTVLATAAPTITPNYQFLQCDPNNTGQADCCNGLEGICDLRADEIMYATLHNGMATFENGFVFGANHQSPLEEALEAGYRGLNLDICNCGGKLVFCHGFCAIAPRDIVDVMQNVNTFLDRNPTETIVFIYQVDDDADQEVDLNQFYDQMLLVDGLMDKLYVHDSPDSAWPTLRQLTEPAFNKRIIMFHYNGPNCNANPEACPDGLHQYYTYASDNDWSNSDVESIEDRVNSCELKFNGINNNVFVGLNNFVSPPSRKSAQTLNAYAAASDYVDTCTEVLQTDINFLLVDYWSEGDLPRFTQDHNAARALRQQQRNLLRST